MKWLIGLLCLFFLILFHEFGHFLAAKLFGVKVESFSVGFGPILLHKTIKGTDYRLSLFPLGGYCGMKGEKDFQKAIEENLSSISGEKDSLYGVHPLKRAAIGFAGPFFNFLLAVVAYSLINMIGYPYKTYSNKIILADDVYEDFHSPAKEAGILTGDEIIEINGKTIEDFSDLIQQVSIRPDEVIKIKVRRNDEILDFIVHTELNKEQGTGKIGVTADTSIILSKESKTYSFFPAFGHGFLDALDTVSITLKSFSILFKGIQLENAVSGPARVTDILGSTIQEGFKVNARIGFISTFELLGIISISLFIMNLLPIPVLDGGLILIALIEWISRKKVNPKVQYYIQFVGLAFIIAIFFLGTFSDIKYFISNK